MKIKGNIVDIPNRTIFSGEIEVKDGIIVSTTKSNEKFSNYIIPGFIDSHIHIESSMLVPSEFAKIAVKHGTVATVSDPHEIANVLGVEGVDFMIKNGKTVLFKFNFGAPSCVPATNFESAGAIIDANAIKKLLSRRDIKYLAEMMNYPGVIYEDKEVLKKIQWANHFKKPIDGHAPGLRGDEATKYINAGITTDHECFTYEEALEKLNKGMKILIREGSAAKNFDALIDLLSEHFHNIMFCSDDKHPDDLLIGHIDLLCKRAVKKGVDVFKVLQAACINPVDHYKLDVGILRVGDAADFVVVEDLQDFKVLQTYIDGQLVYNQGESLIKTQPIKILNNFNCNPKTEKDFYIGSKSENVRIIEALEGELITNEVEGKIIMVDGNCCSNIEEDILKIAVVNRYNNAPPAIGFIKNFGLKKGAIASSVAHDSHNIIVVGTTDNDICSAVNLIIENKGGICAVNKGFKKILKLPIAGIMSDENAENVARNYMELDQLAKQFGSKLNAPFMTLSFMALLVIPNLKLSDKGLFDGRKFKFTSLEKN